MNRDKIRKAVEAEFGKFFGFPGEDGTAVDSFSAKIFAKHVCMKLIKEEEDGSINKCEYHRIRGYISRVVDEEFTEFIFFPSHHKDVITSLSAKFFAEHVYKIIKEEER